MIPSGPSSEEPVTTLAERTYRQLRDEIITAILPPGTLLRERELMERLHVGRTPIREALLLLQRDGFVDVRGRNGTFVCPIRITDFRAIYEARAKNESWATRLAAERLTEEERSTAGRFIEELQGLERPAKPEMLLALDRRIHRFIYRATKNPFLYDTLDHYHDLSLRILYVAMKRYPQLQPGLDRVVQQQVAMLEAVCRGDGDEAERIALEHVESFEADARRMI
jgi:DNA-binding GntR family transcriptional regulator